MTNPTFTALCLLEHYYESDGAFHLSCEEYREGNGACAWRDALEVAATAMDCAWADLTEDEQDSIQEHFACWDWDIVPELANRQPSLYTIDTKEYADTLRAMGGGDHVSN